MLWPCAGPLCMRAGAGERTGQYVVARGRGAALGLASWADRCGERSCVPSRAENGGGGGGD